MKFIILATFGLAQCTGGPAGAQPPDDAAQVSGIGLDHLSLGGPTGEAPENLPPPDNVGDSGFAGDDDYFYDGLTYKDDRAYSTWDDPATWPSGQRDPPGRGSGVNDPPAGRPIGEATGAQRPPDDAQESGISVDDSPVGGPTGEATGALPAPPDSAGDSGFVDEDVDLLEIQEGLYGEVIVDRRLVPERELQVKVPASAMLSWDPSSLTLKKLAMPENKVYNFDMVDNADDDNIRLKIDGFPTETATKVEIFSSHGNAVAKIREVPFKVVPRPRAPRNPEQMRSFMAYVQTIEAIKALFKSNQYNRKIDGTCFGLTTVWLDNRMQSNLPPLDADTFLLRNLRTLTHDWNIAKIIQEHQAIIKSGLTGVRAKRVEKSPGVFHSYRFDHPDLLYTRLDRNHASTQHELASSSHLLNWMTRDGASEFAYLSTQVHAMGLVFHHNSETADGKYSFSFFDPNSGIMTFSHDDIEIMKNDAINYFEKTFVAKAFPQLYNYPLDAPIDYTKSILLGLNNDFRERYGRINDRDYGMHHNQPRSLPIPLAHVVTAMKVPRNDFDEIVKKINIQEELQSVMSPVTLGGC